MDIKEFKNVFEKYLNCIDVKLNDEQFNKFYLYMKELLEWNQKINLTAITEPNEIILKHFVDSIIISKYIKDTFILDIGTGAGFPGIPVKIVNDNLNVTLLDSLNKRINFLNEIINKLSLFAIKAVHGRAEEFGNNLEYRENFDIVTSRAVANLEVLSEYMLPFTKIGRNMYLYERTG